MKFVTLGLDHRHAFGMTAQLQAAGAECIGYLTEGTPNTLPGWTKRFPDIPRLPSLDAALDSGAAIAVLANVPADRAGLAITCLDAGLDVLSDKPGCVSFEQLDAIKTSVSRTKRKWLIDFSERFEVPCATMAGDLIRDGAIGKVVQTIGMGPHRLNRTTRPDWFFDRARYGGILTDIASHQIDQFLHFTGSDSAEVTMAHVANHANPNDPGLQDFGELSLRSAHASGYIRVDWYTPDALPNWGDGRLTILGTEGYIELRKYVDIGGQGDNHLILVNETRCEKIDASDAGLPFFGRFLSDVESREETAVTQSHVFTVMELALTAQAIAEGEA